MAGDVGIVSDIRIVEVCNLLWRRVVERGRAELGHRAVTHSGGCVIRSNVVGVLANKM